MNNQVVLPEDYYGPNERVDAGQASNLEWPGRDALLTIARQNARTARTQSAAAAAVAACSTTTHRTRKKASSRSGKRAKRRAAEAANTDGATPAMQQSPQPPAGNAADSNEAAPANAPPPTANDAPEAPQVRRTRGHKRNPDPPEDTVFETRDPYQSAGGGLGEIRRALRQVFNARTTVKVTVPRTPDNLRRLSMSMKWETDCAIAFSEHLREAHEVAVDEAAEQVGREHIRRSPATFAAGPVAPEPHMVIKIPEKEVYALGRQGIFYEDAMQVRATHKAVPYRMEEAFQIPPTMRLTTQDPAHINDFPPHTLPECTTCGCGTLGVCPHCQHCGITGGLTGELYELLYGVRYRPLCSVCQAAAAGARCRFCQLEDEAVRASTKINWVQRAVVSILTNLDYFDHSAAMDGRPYRSLDDEPHEELRFVAETVRRAQPDLRQHFWHQSPSWQKSEKLAHQPMRDRRAEERAHNAELWARGIDVKAQVDLVMAGQWCAELRDSNEIPLDPLHRHYKLSGIESTEAPATGLVLTAAIESMIVDVIPVEPPEGNLPTLEQRCHAATSNQEAALGVLNEEPRAREERQPLERELPPGRKRWYSSEGDLPGTLGELQKACAQRRR
jgi:hypothetical protein